MYPIPAVTSPEATMDTMTTPGIERRGFLICMWIQKIAGPTQCLDSVGCKAFIQFQPQPAHMCFDNIGFGVKAEIPDLVQKHGASHNTVGTAHKLLQQAEFL